MKGTVGAIDDGGRSSEPAAASGGTNSLPFHFGFISGLGDAQDGHFRRVDDRG